MDLFLTIFIGLYWSYVGVLFSNIYKNGSIYFTRKISVYYIHK